MDARIFICALIAAVGSSILTAPAQAQGGDRIEEILPPESDCLSFKALRCKNSLG